ncbi:hypothetical protein M0R04_07390 [Candidatus Dojkabacteria bacterium]|jgi:hypothetical protein|nr:hypothetical protein [Candidatus Dojkabacteria bacterium]
MMKGPAQENELARKSKEMNKGSIPMQTDNTDYGKKRKAKNHKFSVKSTGKDKKTYWTPAIAERLTFSGYLIQEDAESKTLEKLTSLPAVVVGELKKLIRKGGRDLNQSWSDAKELCDTAYMVSKIRRPIPTQKSAWKQYEELLKYAVHQLWDSRGNKGSWRKSEVVYSESATPTMQPLSEDVSKHRYFVSIPNTADVEVEGEDLGEVVHDLINKLRRHGSTARIVHHTQEGAILAVMKDGEQVEEIIIKHIS